jgi:hypothetical protein
MIKIYSTSYRRPDFIELQHKYLTKYCTDDFKLIIINNGENDEMDDLISKMCLNLGIGMINIEKNHLFPSMSHFVAMNQALNNYIKKDKDWEIAVVMDSDIFPFKQFSFKDILGNFQIGGMYQQRRDTEVEYLCAIFTLFNNTLDITNLDFSGKDGVDTGGKTDDFLKQYNITPNWINHTAAIDIETDYIFQNNNGLYPYKKEYRCQFIADCLFHYYRGGNWDNMPENYHEDKSKFLNYFLEHPEEYNLNLNQYVHYPKAHSEKGWNAIDHSYHGYKFITK